MLKIRKKDGFASFLEVVISAMIFIIAGFGIFTAMSTLSPQTQNSNNRLQAAIVGKNIIDTLYKDMNAEYLDMDNCPEGPLCIGTKETTIGEYSITKTVEHLGASRILKVTIDINYPD